jgi:iron complex outermembrane receptor protein
VKINNRHRRTLIAAIGLGMLGAAEAAPAPAEGQELDEIVVTARKRSENLQDVAVAVSALGTKELARRFDVDLQDFANAAPSVIIDDLQQGPGSSAAIAIRGIGTTDVEKSFDPATGVVLDGIFIGANSGAMLRALDISAVEILRGPQGTLFGRNSIAGVINISRSKPTGELGGQFRAGYGNYNDLQLDGFVNIPVTDQIALKLGGAKRSHDGYFFNATTNRSVGKKDFKSIDPSILYKPMENLEFVYRFDKTWQTQDADTVQNLAQPGQLWCSLGTLGLAKANHCAQGVTVPESGDRYVVLENGFGDPAQPYSDGAYFNTEMHNFSARWALSPEYELNYIFGYFKTDEKVYQDFDATNETLFHTNRPAKYQQHSHELRLTHTSSGPFSYVVGLYGWSSGYRIDLRSYIGFAVPGLVLDIPQTVQQSTKSQAVFAEGDYKFTDDWTLTLGGRYTHDKKTSGLIDPSIIPDVGSVGYIDNPFEQSWSQFTPKASLKYKITPDVMTYVLYSRGFRAGGFDGRPGSFGSASKPYDPEKVDNVELGVKSEFWGKRVRLNADVFYMKYKNKQEELNVPTSSGTGEETRVLNASSADLKGVEVDFAVNPLTGLSIAGNIGLLQAKYKDFLVQNLVGPPTDLSYLHLRRSPSATGTLSVTYEWPMFGGRAWVQNDWHYIGAEQLTFANSPQGANPHQNIVDPSLNFAYGKSKFSVYAKNITKDDAWSQAYDVANLWTYTTTRPPRTYGAQFTQSF